MQNQFAHLGLARWPFSVVPSREHCNFIADRTQLKSDLEALLQNLSRHDMSQINLFWAWLGAGKTHTLYYLANRLAEVADEPQMNRLHVVYSEFPRTTQSFLDVYRSFAAGLDMDDLINAFLEISTCPDSARLQRELMLTSPDLFSALRVLSMGELQNQVTALRWLRGESIAVSTLRSVGIAQRINSSEVAIKIVGAVVGMFGHAARANERPGSLVLWIIDEFQRITSASPRIRNEINTGLHSAFNACPSGLSMFLSFSGKPEPTLPDWSRFTGEARCGDENTPKPLRTEIVRERLVEVAQAN